MTDLELEFGEGEVFEAQVKREIENEPEQLEHRAHIPIKSGRTVYKSLEVWKIPASSSEKPYILEFFKWKKNEGLLTEDEQEKFRCQKEQISTLLAGLSNIEEFDPLDSDNYAIIKKNSPSEESLKKIIEVVENLDQEESTEIVEEITSQLSNLFETEADYNFDELLDSEVLEAESFLAHARLKQKIQEFRTLIEDELREQRYQDFLENNSWIFGSKYNNKVDFREITYAEEVDFCLQSVDGYFDVIEIKRPQHQVLKYDDSHDNYYPSDKLSEAIRQTENYIHKIEDQKTMILNETNLDIVKPRGIIVIGRELSEEKKENLRVINSHLNRIEIRTYSELLDIGSRIVDNYEEKQELNELNIGE